MFFRRSPRKQPAPLEKLDDAELIRQYQDLDAEPRWNVALVGELFQRYVHLVYGVCLKYLRNEDDAKDAVMQVFEKLVEELKRNTAHDRTIVHFKGWLHTLVKNHCLMWLRSRQSKGGREAIAYSFDELVRNADSNGEDGPGVEFPGAGHLGEEESLEQELTRMEKGLRELPAEQRVCLDLFYLQQKCYKEVAQITGYDLNKVKSYIQNGKRNLRIYVEKHQG